MIRINSPFGKTVSVLCSFAVVFCGLPSMALASTYKQANDWVKEQLPKAKPALMPSKILSNRGMKQMQGRLGENPYAAGQQKWDVVYKGVDLMTGNFTTSGTDLTFEGGYGIPANVTRSYSANAADEGPLGPGWTLSVDVRSTAGGVMKSSGAPVRSIPVNFKERPSTQLSDPNAVTADGSNGSGAQPIAAVMATDSGGTEEVIQRDADGILSTPPWDKNKIDSEYETIVDSGTGTNYQIMKKNWVNTPEGTVYVYEKQGTYTAGVSRYQGQSEMSAPSDNEPSNVLKIKTATDRHGNTTTYTYGSGTVSFDKVNGTTSEHPLTAIQMPNGHKIAFDWTGNRMTKAKEIGASSTVLREVTYGYTSGMLTSVTTPAGKTTTYGYGACSTGYTGAATPPPPGGNYPQTLMTSITDSRGLTTTVLYEMDHNYRYGVTPMVRKISWPNSQYTDFFNYSATVGAGNEAYGFTDYYLDSSTKVYTNTGQISLHISSNEATVYETRAISGDMSFAQPALRELTYNLDTMDLVKEVNRAYDFVPNAFFPYIFGDPNMPPALVSKTETTSKFNFVGIPLEKQLKEYTFSGTYGSDFTTFTLDRTATTGYSYWGGEKYYQQKAVKDPGGRYSFTDYYDNTATAGKKGQTYKVFDQERVGIAPNTGVTPPDYAIVGTEWRYQIEVADNTKYSAKFDYDTKGRATDVWKIQNKSSWTYVQTHTTFGSDTDGSWGGPSSVVEDYGGINRTTAMLQYDTSGRAIKIEDAAGKVFHTTYDADGVTQSIEQIVGGVSIPVVTYTYGTSGITKGQVLNVTDNLSGVSQDITYTTSGAGKGNVASATETKGLDSYSTSYTYNSAGDRDIATFTTQAALSLSAVAKWKYSDYIPLGLPTKGAYLFQRLTALDPSTGSPSSEEFHYAYDYQGRPRQATFAQTPQSGFTPSSGGFYYDASHKPATRARTYTEYDSGGRIKGVYNWWDTWNSGTSSFTSAPIRKNECTYELSSLNRGLKTQSKFYNVSSGSWNLQRTESYGYDSKRDYLTSANYGDGLANATPSWTYDDSSNRASDSTVSGSWTYDNLNRMTASPGYTYINTIDGNRLEKTGSSAWAVRHSWDVLNRMTQSYVNGSSDVVSMTYRADGMRVTKANAVPGNNANKFTHYRYDGQMGIEDVEVTSGGTYNSITRYAIGVRGVDAISRTTSGGTAVSYPLYDAHGSNTGLLAKSGSSWSISDERSYDAWGQVRSGGTTGDQKGRYSANIGHKQDDESGLTYMRARFYESESGRFISQDRAMDGLNWFTYSLNNPVNNVDFSGNSVDNLKLLIGLLNYMCTLIASGGQLQTGGLVSPWEMIDKIDEILEAIQKETKIKVIWGNAQIEVGETQYESAKFMGILADIQAQLGEANTSLGVKKHAEASAAIISARCADAMKELLRQMML